MNGVVYGMHVLFGYFPYYDGCVVRCASKKHHNNTCLTKEIGLGFEFHELPHIQWGRTQLRNQQIRIPDNHN